METSGASSNTEKKAAKPNVSTNCAIYSTEKLTMEKLKVSFVVM